MARVTFTVRNSKGQVLTRKRPRPSKTSQPIPKGRRGGGRR